MTIQLDTFSEELRRDGRIGNVVRARAALHPDRELFMFNEKRVTYGEFDAWVNSVAALLIQNQVGRGDSILIQLPNCLEALVLQVAAFRIGALNVPIVPIYREHEVAQIVRDSRPKVVAAAAELGSRRPVDEIDHILDDAGIQPAIKFVVNGSKRGWEDVPAAGDLDAVELPEPGDPDDPAAVLYTSGTTAAPKGVILSSRALIEHLRNYATGFEVDSDSVFGAGTPLSHLGGFVNGLVMPAFLGARAVIMPAWNPDEAVQLIDSERVTLMAGATVFIQDLVQRYARQDVGHRLSKYVCSGSTIPPELIRQAHRLGVDAVRVYGLTEAAGVVTFAAPTDPAEFKAEWDGRPVDNMEIEVVDQVTRKPIAIGEIGEFRLRGPQRLTAYTDSVRTAEQIDDDGWYYTGDLGVMNAEGWIKMTGRSKDIINRGGEKFSTMDIEAAIASHPSIARAAVTAIPDPRLGETVGAWVVLADGATWDGPQAVLGHLDDMKLTKSKFPVEWHVIEAIPATATGKTQKHALAETTDLAFDTAYPDSSSRGAGR